MKSSGLFALFAALIVSACAAQSTPIPTATHAVPTTTPTATATLKPSPTATATVTATRTPTVTPTLAVTTVKSNPKLPGYIDVVAFGTSLDGETLTAAFALRDLPETFSFNRQGVPLNSLEYSWCALVYLNGKGSVKGSKSADYWLCTQHYMLSGPGSISSALDGYVQTQVWVSTGTFYSMLSQAKMVPDYSRKTITLIGHIPGITAKSLVLFDAYDFLGGESYSR